MSALTCDRNTASRPASLRTLVAASAIYAGAIVAVNAAGKAVPASDTANLRVVGVAQHAAAAGEKITVSSGCFAFDGPTVTAADLDKTVYVADDQTVNTVGGTNKVVAGTVFDVDDEGVWVKIG